MSKVIIEQETVVRAFELPIHGVDAGGRDGWALLRECWEQSTALANWGVTQLLSADVMRLPDMAKLPARPQIKGPAHKGLYGLATDTLGLKTGFWAGACISASTILRDVERKYVQDRYAVLWLRNKAPCTYRYPYPWPVHAQSWIGAGYDDAGKPWVRVALPGGHVMLRLRGGPEFGRQLGLFRQVVSGELPKLQLVIRQQGTSLGCHRPTIGKREPVRVMVKMVARLPKPPAKEGRTLVLLTDPASFWVAEIDNRQAWVLNNDYMRRGLAAHAEHQRRLQRMSEDAKSERRLGSNRTRQIQARLDRLCDKHHDRMQSWTHEAAAHLVKFCERQGVAEVLYLDRDKGFMPKFPWHQLLSKLVDKATMAGINVYTESGMGRLPESEDGDGGIDLATKEGDEKWLRITRLREWAAGKVLTARKRSASHPQVSVPCGT